MRISKSCEDIKIQNGYYFDPVDPNANYLAPNSKSKQCQRQTEMKCQIDAYELAKNQIVQAKKGVKLMQPVFRHKKNYKRTVSQDNIQRLLDLENKTQMQAFSSLCVQNPYKLRSQIMCTAKQLSKMKFQNLKGCIKRIELTKNVMNQVVVKNTNQIQKNKPNQTNQSSQWSQSQTSRTFQSSRMSINQQTCSKRVYQEKQNYFRNKLMSGCDFNELFQTERRKQCWKGFMEAQRNQIRQNKGNNCGIKFGTFNPKFKKRGKNKYSELDDQLLANHHYAQYQMNKKMKKGLNEFSRTYRINMK